MASMPCVAGENSRVFDRGRRGTGGGPADLPEPPLSHLRIARCRCLVLASLSSSSPWQVDHSRPVLDSSNIVNTHVHPPSQKHQDQIKHIPRGNRRHAAWRLPQPPLGCAKDALGAVKQIHSSRCHELTCPGVPSGRAKPSQQNARRPASPDATPSSTSDVHP